MVRVVLVATLVFKGVIIVRGPTLKLSRWQWQNNLASGSPCAADRRRRAYQEEEMYGLAEEPRLSLTFPYRTCVHITLLFPTRRV